MNGSGLEFDLAVIGGGPAGSAAAITAARLGAKVALLEAGEFPRHKVCGEFVSAESLDVLRNLLQTTPGAEAALANTPVIDQVRLLLAGREVQAPMDPPALSIPRYDLDLLLWQAAQQAGVQTCLGCEVRTIGGNGPFQLDTSCGRFEAVAVIIAAGRWSRFAPRTPVPDGPKWVGLKAHFRETQPRRSTDLYFFESGYCGVQPVADDVVNACAMVRSDRATSLEEVFTLHPVLAQRRRNWQSIMDPITTAPLIYRTPEPVKDNLIFVGDAAAFIDPFVGDGISIALRTGCLAASELKTVFDRSSLLDSALTSYQKQYKNQFAPLIAAASRIRALLALPRPMQIAALQLLRFPVVLPYLIRKTRRST